MTTELTPQQARTMPGSFAAYRRTDGGQIADEYEWIAHDYDCGMVCGEMDPIELEEFVMVPVRVNVFMCHEDEEADDDDE